MEATQGGLCALYWIIKNANVHVRGESNSAARDGVRIVLDHKHCITIINLVSFFFILFSNHSLTFLSVFREIHTHWGIPGQYIQPIHNIGRVLQSGGGVPLSRRGYKKRKEEKGKEGVEKKKKKRAKKLKTLKRRHRREANS